MNKYLAVLGRQPELSVAELEALYGPVKLISPELAELEVTKASAATVSCPLLGILASPGDVMPDLARLGGSLKVAREITNPVDFLKNLAPGRKLVIGVSDYSPQAQRKTAQRESLRLKKLLVQAGRSVRVLSNDKAVLSTATVYHNGLGRKDGRVELLKVKQKWYVGLGVQDIDAYAGRDQARPARDAKVGMLPPKLAQILINLCGPLSPGARVLDPFCGTGVVLQEATLMGYRPYGSDISEKMVEYSRRNLTWLRENWGRVDNVRGNSSRKNGVHPLTNNAKCAIIEGWANTNKPDSTPDKNYWSRTSDLASTPDKNSWLYTSGLASTPVENLVVTGSATEMRWEGKIDAVTCEIYLGSPMSKPPTGIKLRTEKQRCKEILLGFLRNIYPQIASGTPLCLAIPAWRQGDSITASRRHGSLTTPARRSENDISPQKITPEHPDAPLSSKNHKFSRLNPLDEIEQMGYNVIKSRVSSGEGLIYFRAGQVVAREIIVLRKK